MTPWDWLAPSTASRTRVSYTGRRGGALVVEFELDALAAGDVLDRHLAERRRLVASQARKIDDGEALGRRLHVVEHVGAGDLAQLLDHPIGGQFAALGALCPSLFDRRGDVGFCYILAAELGAFMETGRCSFRGNSQ